ncbi:ZIP family zinc transporter [Pleurostoma richardsiae]|uniref:ZIP family zinc transporter n=1 Tax=Pleurostoma richardsiae TaxID=41990 RepID=A0AA38R2N1_9PEZI|nr:ZIP family zinc transporter [Pleurostoma richardsiae]
MEGGTDLTRDISWSSIPTELLLAELSKREDETSKPQCGSGEKGFYNTSLHVFALILILVLSVLACGFPLFSNRSSRGRRQSRFVFLCQHFGTGVLIATAFVHLLPTAFTSLTDPCLPYFFNQGYPPLPGLVAMASALVVVGLEQYLTTRGAGHSHSHDLWDEDDESEDNGNLNTHGGGLAARRAPGHRPDDIALDDLGASEGLMAGVSPLPESTPTTQANGKDTFKRDSPEDDFDDQESLDLELNLDELDPTSASSNGHRQPLTGAPLPKEPSTPALPHIPNPEEQKRLLLQCLLLEAGILFHSVFIGMALSVATGPPFIVFLVAIAFHQSFEGLALGSRIAAIHFPKSSPRPWLMVLAYGTTTPIGQAIGLVIHNFYDPMSQTGLLMVGFMNAISSGLLLFAGLVQLLAEDFLTEKSYKTLRGRRRVHAFLAVLGGASLMAVVGAFA